MARILLQLLATALMLAMGAQAQFGFFEQMFSGGQQQQQHHQGPQNVPSDPSWYQQNYENGIYMLNIFYPFTFDIFVFYSVLSI